ncbi:hypothetical protein [Microbacterium aoyamense]|uniref:hypothetical protein n=1 Tax=Microbacterium aoyamense TaxID=344166 RepID=UPI002005E557|nr:hypothetical protein [Microbacterium aoyamense]
MTDPGVRPRPDAGTDRPTPPPTGDVEIRGGGAVAVDTQTLRDAASRFDTTRAELDALRDRLGSLQLMLFAERDVAWGAASSASVLLARLAETMADADAIAADLRSAATVYELVELNAQHTAARLAGDEVALARIEARRDDIMRLHPDAMGRANLFEFERAVLWPSELVREATQLGYDLGGMFETFFGEGLGKAMGFLPGVVGGVVLGGLTIGGVTAAGLGGQGRVARNSRLTGDAPAVAIVRVGSGTTTAPSGLAAAAQRIPSGDARVRVEVYTMRDGSKQYATYIAGMKDAAVRGGRDPWDNESNVQLWAGEKSASYAATARALEAAGARPGDTVHIIGHSQGAMVGAHLALEGGYDTRTLVTFGSPVEADVGPGTVSVGIRHSDDAVAALAGGGHAAPVGAPGSFVVERVFDEDPGLTSHGISAYADTAAKVDASTDPRVDAVRETFAELGTAVEVDVVEYSAERLDAVSPASASVAGRSRRSS